MSTPAPQESGSSDIESRLRDALAPAYQLVKQLGAGGMGTVWLAREPALRRDVAVKVLAPELVADAESRGRFEREAQAVAAFSHPNVVGIHGLGALSDGTPYFVMQCVAGKSLADRVHEEGPLPLDEARRIVGEVAAALAAAHKKGIVHRDIKPANVLYDSDSGRALVSDFGISAVRAAEGVADVKLTQTGASIGTPKYMSPEALLAEPVTGKTDVYALGLLAYELVLGNGPFKEVAPQALMAAHLRDVPPRLSTQRKEVDPELDEVVAACLAKDPDARPTADDVARRFAPGAETLLEWPPPGLDPYAGMGRDLARNAGRASVMIILGTLILIALGSLGSNPLAPGIGFIGTMLIVLGSLSWVRWMFRAARDFVRVGPALAHGYSWLTIAEVAADQRRDTGALIAGSKEYTGIMPNVRALLRRRRLQSASAAVVGALVTPLLILLVALVTGGRPTSVWWPVALIVGVPVGLLFVSTALLEGERRLVAVARRRLEARHREADRFGGLVAPWQKGFDAVQGVGGLGRGTAGRKSPGRLAAAGFTISALVLSYWLVPLIIIGYGSAKPPRARFDETMARRRNHQVMALLSSWAPPIDSSITPLAAGVAQWTITGLLVPPSLTTQRLRPFPAFERLPTLPPDHITVEQDRLGLTTLSIGADSMRLLLRLDSTLVINALAGKLPFERARLDSIVKHPVWTLWSTVSRARTMDGVGARTEPGAFEEMPLEPPGWNLVDRAVTRITALNHARVASHLAAGRPAAAIAVLREEVGFMRAASTEAFESSATTIAGRLMERALGAALLIHERTGTGQSAEAQRLRADVVRARAIIADRAPSDTLPSERQALFAALMTSVRDTAMPMALRFQALGALASLRCMTLRGALFGNEPDVTAAFAYARDSVARWPSERELLRGVERTAFEVSVPFSPLSSGVTTCAIYSLVR